MKIKVIEKEQNNKKKTVGTVDITDTIERMRNNTFYRFNRIEIEKKNGRIVITTKLNNKVMHVMSPLRGVNFNCRDIISLEGFEATSDVIMSWDK